MAMMMDYSRPWGVWRLRIVSCCNYLLIVQRLYMGDADDNANPTVISVAVCKPTRPRFDGPALRSDKPAGDHRAWQLGSWGVDRCHQCVSIYIA